MKNKKEINFIGNRKKAYGFSAILLLITIVSLVINKGPNMSIDFVGGISLQVQFDTDVTEKITKIRDIISNIEGLSSPDVKMIGKATPEMSQVQIVVKSDKDNQEVGGTIKGALSTKMGEVNFTIEKEDQVGPKIGKELQANAIWAILLSLLVIVIYMGIRFQIPFGVAAIVALFHDVVITIGVFSLLGWEISLPIIAAILTIVGYSLNDTIVVFDRIRENLANAHKKGGSSASFEDKINSSINQTISRTLITSLTTLVVVLAIFAFFFDSVNVLKYFSGALIVGIISGTYSSIYIASPVLVFWNNRKPLVGEEADRKREEKAVSKIEGIV